MSRFSRALKIMAASLAAAMMVVTAAPQSHAENGVVRLTIAKAGFILGVGGGDGALAFRGNVYPLSVGGVGIGSLGMATVHLKGTASNLRTASDIAGTYATASAGATFINGSQVATLRNEKGVVLTLHGVQAGFQLSLGLGGMTVALR